MHVFVEKLLDSVKALSVDDVYLAPGLAEIDPRKVDLRTRFSRDVELLIPIAASPMDTVTEFDMAVAMALLGGIGVVHRNMEIEKQVEIVRRVKEHPPIRLRHVFVEPEMPCGRVLEYMHSNNVRNLPVVDSEGIAIGYIHIADLKSRCLEGLEVVEPRPGKAYRISEVQDAKKALLEGSIDTLAIVDSLGRYIGTLFYQDVLAETQPAVDKDGRLVIAAAISPFDKARALKLDRYVDALVSDVAHFHNVDVLKASRDLVKEVSADFVAGNIASDKAVEDVATWIERVDGFRVGLGGGSICTTPDVTGVYVPTLYAVALVRDAVDKLNLRVPVIADGGIRAYGDIVKVLAAGASVAMLGYMLAGTEEASAPIISIGGAKYKPYRGMASEGAMKRRYAIDRYARVSKKVEEGIEGLVPYRGSVYVLVPRIVEAVKAGLGYVGARNIEELWKKARFIATQKKVVRVKTEI
jgi:IMP dehydrogenase